MAEHLTKEQVEQCKQAFAACDTNGDGTINSQELGKVMQALGHNLSEEELKALIAMIDTDHDSVINFQEFLEMVAKKTKVWGSKEEMQAVFRQFDENDDGHITLAELKQAMIKLGAQLSDEEVDAMIREADLDQDGQVNYQEFERMLTKK
ncbi:calmodulin-like protein 5 [Orycteropus afer afer]|uniref:Calmodulin-like protein 5 n=1 Tax=Orycteropus afer afer TaxID=1230840 RepID=A0A8B6ZDC1_ORYAF|nr:calmodulin-like protein 5 [Orycteropus afer afer]